MNLAMMTPFTGRWRRPDSPDRDPVNSAVLKEVAVATKSPINVHEAASGARPTLMLAAEAAILSSLVRLGLRLVGTAATLRAAERVVGFRLRRRAISAPLDRSNVLLDIPRAVRAVGARPPFEFTCLPRSITTWVMLRRRDIPVSFRLGVGGTATNFASHAWVEFDSMALGEDPDIVAMFHPLPIQQVMASTSGLGWRLRGARR